MRFSARALCTGFWVGIQVDAAHWASARDVHEPWIHTSGMELVIARQNAHVLASLEIVSTDTAAWSLGSLWSGLLCDNGRGPNARPYRGTIELWGLVWRALERCRRRVFSKCGGMMRIRRVGSPFCGGQLHVRLLWSIWTPKLLNRQAVEHSACKAASSGLWRTSPSSGARPVSFWVTVGANGTKSDDK